MTHSDTGPQERALDRWVRVQHDVLMPLGRAQDFGNLLEVAEDILKDEAELEFRRLLIQGVSAILHANGRPEESLTWCKRAVAEAPADPLAQNALAMWYYANPLRDPTQAELDEALEYSAAAVKKARASNTWRRHVLHDRCRIAVAAKRYDIVAEAMAEILEARESPCEPDIPVVEGDWLDKIPAGAIEPSLLGRYRAALA